MIAEILTDQLPSERRQEARTTVFAMATIYTDAGSMPVKVRDLSSTGALAEGPVLPPLGTKIRLRRATLEAVGEVQWSKAGRVGLRFESAIEVADWLPRGRSIAAQDRIDDMVHEARKSLKAAPPVGAKPISSKKPTPLDLIRVKQAVESLAEDLADDPAVVERHGARLQVLDLVSQTLRNLAIHGH